MLGAALLMASSGSAPASTLLTGIMRYYPLHSDAIDVAGGNNGTVTSPVFVSGPISNALSSDSSVTRKIACPPLIFPNVAYFSLNFWVKYPAGSIGSFQGVADQGDGSSGGAETFSILGGSCAIYGQGGAPSVSVGNAWKMVTFVCDNTNTFVYADGALFGSAGRTVPPSPDIVNSFYLAGRRDNYAAGSATFHLAEFGVWSRALTALEIAELYNAGAGKAYPF